MKALILAAGQGVRLMPLTDDRPKCLVRLQERTLLERILETLAAVGISDVVVVTGYKAEKIEAFGVKTVKNGRFAVTNMVATLFAAESAFPADQDMLISYADIVYEPRILEALMACQAAVGVAVNTRWRNLWAQRFDDPLSDAETLRIGEGNRLLELGRKPKSYDEVEAQYMGLIKIRADHVARLGAHYRSMDRHRRYDGKDFDNMYMTTFIQDLINSNWDVRAVPVEGGWLEVDNVADLETYEKLASSGMLEDFIHL